MSLKTGRGIYEFTLESSTKFHTTFILADSLKQAEKFAEDEGKAWGCKVHDLKRSEKPKVLRWNESYVNATGDK